MLVCVFELNFISWEGVFLGGLGGWGFLGGFFVEEDFFDFGGSGEFLKDCELERSICWDFYGVV